MHVNLNRIFANGVMEPARLVSEIAALSRPVSSDADWRRYTGNHLEYEAVCLRLEVPSQPVSFVSLSVYALHCHRMLRNCAATVEGKVSHVRTVAAFLGHGSTELEGSSERKLITLLLSKLGATDVSSKPKRRAVTLYYLRAIVRAMDKALTSSSTTAADRVLWRAQRVMLLLAHQALLRVSELVGLTAADVAFRFKAGCAAPVSLVLSLYDTKTSTTSEPALVPVVARDDELDVVRLLYAYMNEDGLLDVSARDRYIFDFARCDPRSHASDALPPPPARRIALFDKASRERYKRRVTDYLRFWLKRSGAADVEGEQSAAWCSHGLRHGGLCDALDALIPLDFCMLLGRWKSTAWITYRHSSAALEKLLTRMAVQLPLGVSAQPDLAAPFAAATLHGAASGGPVVSSSFSPLSSSASSACSPSTLTSPAAPQEMAVGTAVASKTSASVIRAPRLGRKAGVDLVEVSALSLRLPHDLQAIADKHLSSSAAARSAAAALAELTRIELASGSDDPALGGEAPFWTNVLFALTANLDALLTAPSPYLDAAGKVLQLPARGARSSSGQARAADL
jgi:hypothetical protein